MSRIQLRPVLLAPITVALLGCQLVGCQSGPLGGLAWGPFASKPTPSNYRTPTKRIEEIEQFAAEAQRLDAPGQTKFVAELASRLQSETDPLVRESIIVAAAPLKPPMAGEILLAGLKDDDAGIRRRCCSLLGQRGDPSSVQALKDRIEVDEDLDVRLAAVEALGGIQSPEAVQALTLALKNRDPALQLAGVESMRRASGQDYGRDVEAYLAYASGETPPPRSTPGMAASVAEKVRQWTPFY